jgi:hypothetical protein
MHRPPGDELAVSGIVDDHARQYRRTTRTLLIRNRWRSDTNQAGDGPREPGRDGNPPESCDQGRREASLRIHGRRPYIAAEPTIPPVYSVSSFPGAEYRPGPLLDYETVSLIHSFGDIGKLLGVGRMKEVHRVCLLHHSASPDCSNSSICPSNSAMCSCV